MARIFLSQKNAAILKVAKNRINAFKYLKSRIDYKLKTETEIAMND